MSGLFGKKQSINNTESRISALRVQQSSQGVPIPIVYGTTRVSPNMMWYGDFRAIAHTESAQAGGKGGGGGSTVTNTTYTYQVAVALGLCEGQIGDDSNIINTYWQNKDVHQFSDNLNPFTSFDGAQAQTPWSYLVTNHANQALGYSNTVYVAAEALPLGNTDSLPNFSFEVIAFFADEVEDVLPSQVLPDLLTSAQYGAGWNSAQIGDITAWDTYCTAAGWVASPAYTEQRTAADIIAELARIGNAGIVWSEGLLKIVPYADEVVGDFTPDLTVQYALTYDDFLAPAGTDPVRVQRKRPADAFNTVQVECLDRANDYNIYVAEAKDQANIDRYGQRTMEPVVMHAVCDIDVARNLAQTILQRELYVRNTYEFTLGWRFARLEPMDIVSLTEPNLGLDGLLVRIVSIEENKDGDLQMVAEDLTIGVSTPGIYDPQATDGYIVNNAVDPGDAAAPVIFQPPVELSGTPQIWIGASGGANWGGAQIWASDDDATYAQVGTITSKARYGVLTANFPAGANPDTVNTLSVDLTISGGALTSATPAEADALDTLSFVGTAAGGELIAYTDATLTGAFTYDLGAYILRGQRCTLSEAHETGASFMRLDAAVAQVAIQESRVGNTVYIKLVSYNLLGGGLQDIESLLPYTYVVQPLGIVAVNGTVPNVITAQQALCIPPGTQYSVQGRMTNAGRINCDGRLIVT